MSDNPENAPEPTQWEYLVVPWEKLNEEDLNEFGRQGWELVAVSSRDSGVEKGYLKRPKRGKYHPDMV